MGRVLSDASYARSAQELAGAMAALPAPDAALDLIGEMAVAA
jgi:UDP:flavonoid glycosyltransferase YjiC (YdhE family)